MTATTSTSAEVSDSAITFDEVTCRIGSKVVLDAVTLTVARGAITGILGPNGAGKTTLLSAVMGLRPVSSGRVTVLGQAIPAGLKNVRARMGVVLQESALYEELTPVENLAFAASLYNVPNPKERIAEVLEIIDLSDRANDLASTLSGGMRRRLTIGRALLHKPDLLVIDEPTLGVDVETRHSIWSHLRVLRSQGTTIVVSTNYLDEVTALCDTVAVLRAGRLLVVETPQTLVARAGSCIDIECSEQAVESVRSLIAGEAGLLRIQPTPSGLSIFLDGTGSPEACARRIVDSIPVSGFRIRGADLAEVFHALE